ncbi:hypothetical protein PSENEW3_00003080 [Picochlorum sp. SENEW3]|nr:hypothetical protein PSENEW3_00003080 [Picochlorum sp. SENEW3]
MASTGRLAALNGICSEKFHKILSENGIKARGTISGGSESYSRDVFCLPNDVPLPLSHYRIVFPVAVDVKTVNSAFRIALGKDMANHTVCPEAANGSTKEHSFFVYVSSNLKDSLGESCIRDEQTKENLLVVYNASQPENTTCSDMTLYQRLCALVLLYSFILFKADARALRIQQGTFFSMRLKDINKTLKKNCKRTASQIVRKAQRSLLGKAYATYQLNLEQPKDSIDVAIPREDASPSSSKGTKRPIDLEDNGLQHDDVSPRSLVRQKMVPGGDGSGDTPEQNASDDGAFDTSPDSVLPQPTCQGTPAAESLPGFNGILPRRPDNGGQHDALRLVQPEGKGSGIDLSSVQGYNNAIFAGLPDSVLPQPTCQGTPAAEFLSGFNGILPRRPDNGGQHDALRLVQPEGKGSGIDLSSVQGYNNAIFNGLPDSVLPQPTCQETPVAEFLSGFNGPSDDDILQNSTPGTPLFVNDNQDGFFMESYDPFAEANPFNDDENRSL